MPSYIIFLWYFSCRNFVKEANGCRILQSYRSYLRLNNRWKFKNRLYEIYAIKLHFFCISFDRKIQAIEDILDENFEPPFSEVDVLGVVINIGNLNNQGYQAIHLCDALFNIVSIQFWGGIGKHSLDSIIKMGSVLLFSNLQWRKSSANGNFFQNKTEFQPLIPCLYVTEFTLVNSDVKETERSRMIKDLSVEVKKVPNFLSEAKIRYSQLTTKRPSKPMVSIDYR